MLKVNGHRIKNLTYNGSKVRKAYYQGTLVYSYVSPDKPDIMSVGLSVNDLVSGFSETKKGSSWYYDAGYYAPTSTEDGQWRMHPRTTGNTYRYVWTNEKIDVSGYSSLCIRMSADRSYGDNTAYGANTMYIGGGLYNEKGDAYSMTSPAKFFLNDITTSELHYTIVIDINDVDGEYYVGAGYWHTTSTTGLGCAKLYDIYFLPKVEETTYLWSWTKDTSIYDDTWKGTAGFSGGTIYLGKDQYLYQQRNICLDGATKITADLNFNATQLPSFVGMALFENSPPTSIPDGGWVVGTKYGNGTCVARAKANITTTGSQNITLEFPVTNYQGTYYLALGHRGYAGSTWNEIKIE